MVKAHVVAVERLNTADRLGAAITVIAGEDIGQVAVVDAESGVVVGSEFGWLTHGVLSDADDLMAREESRALVYGDRRLFIDVIPPPPVMLIFGAGHIAQPLTAFAQSAGFRVVVSDARTTWATPERFPTVDELIVGWPDAVFDHIPVDRRTYVVLLSHDARFEEPVFAAVHRKPVRYLGAMGSRRTHAARVARLKEAGWTAEEVDTIHGPIGLDLKGHSPAETAVAILAEVIQVRYGQGSARPLHGTDEPIHLT